MTPNSSYNESVVPSWNTREYWMNTSEIIKQVPYLANVATKLYAENLEAGSGDLRDFSKGMKDLAYDHGEFIISRFKANPDDPYLQFIIQHCPEINFQTLENSLITERKRREKANVPIQIYDYVPVPVAEGLGQMQTFNALDIRPEYFKELPKQGDKISAAMSESSSGIGQFFKKIFGGEGIALGSHAVITILGLGADYISDSFESLEAFGSAITNRSLSGEQGNAMLAALGLLMLERMAAITTVNSIRDIKNSDYVKGAVKGLLGLGIYTIAIQSFINTMAFVGRSKPGLWIQNWSEFNFISPRFEDWIASTSIFILAVMLNYGAEFYDLLSEVLKSEEKREPVPQRARTVHHGSQPAAAD